ncbi:patatin-like phospholipase family protein [Flavobacteriaceae bacterium]|nr:patatin-like phospholipase family protein [Flavobacteriaceae bacterium]MDC1060893.1 patatin-like phospholipase family protein [Flavobacteriaceae bacterium]
MKKALVISGGGSKGAFAGGISQYLIEESKQSYDVLFGTSTGSLLISHLAALRIPEIKHAFTHVTQASIFCNNPFIVKQKGKLFKTKINHFNVLKNFIKGRKTFGESSNLRHLIEQKITPAIFREIKSSQKEVVVCVSNFTLNTIEYKTLSECSYTDFLDWIWISCNYVPFMSLVIKNKFEYADGGFGCIIAIEEAIRRGATHVDAIMLSTEVQQLNRMRSRNAFDLVLSTLDFMGDQIMEDDIKVGKLYAQEKNVQLRIFHTPRVLTTNSLIFDQDEMERWWQEGWLYAQKQATSNNPM